jgi:hypothetical protein
MAAVCVRAQTEVIHMRDAGLWLFAALMLGSVSCHAGRSAQDLERTSGKLAAAGQPKPYEGYYRVQQNSGDYTLALLNRTDKLCPDGSSASECHVSSLVLPAEISWNPGDVVHGAYAAGSDVLVVDAVLERVGTNESSDGQYLMVHDERPSCVPIACPANLQFEVLQGNLLSAAYKVTFSADEQTRAAMSRAFWAEMSPELAFGRGAIVFGQFDYCAANGRNNLELTRVYKTKPPPLPACVVSPKSQGMSARSFSSLRAARDFALGLDDDDVVVSEQTCGALAESWACTPNGDRVLGYIDAWDDECADFENVCDFERNVINAADWNGSAAGTWELGFCTGGPTGCLIDEDCIEVDGEGFCGFGDGEKICKPWSGLGERCLEFWDAFGPQRCAPQYVCARDADDRGGTCVLP